MILSTWLRSFPAARPRGKSDDRRQRCRLRLELLEDRSVPSTFWVKNTNDGGPDSLRQAVLDANNNPGADTIKFRHSAEGTITLTTGELSVTGDTTIKGPGADDLTVSGGGTTRVFNVAAGANVTIEKLTIANGLVQGEDGGGILNQGSLTLKESVVTGNTALFTVNGYQYTGGHGGGIHNLGRLEIRESKIANNTARNGGGGIFNGPISDLFDPLPDDSTLVVKNSEISGNIAANTGWFGPGGGGVTNGYLATASFDHVRVLNNRCDWDGAGIRSLNATLNVSDSLIKGNIAGYYGTGGIAAGGKVTISKTVVRDNQGTAAGMYLGGFITEQHWNDEILVSQCIITHNIGLDEGSGTYDGAGGIADFAGQKSRIEDTTISDNIGGVAGGFATRWYATPPEIVRSTISGNTAIAEQFHYYSAGGVMAWGAKIENSTISGNTVNADGILIVPFLRDGAAAAGGVLIIASFAGTTGTIDHSTIANNTVVNAPAGTKISGGVTAWDFVASNGRFAHYVDVSLRNTIIARNESNIGGPDVTGNFHSHGHNLIGVLNAHATGFVASDLSGTDASPLDPRLRPLRWNGGPTKTHALRHDSPALNAGDNTDAPATDQRGRDRIVDGIIDIGANEARFHSHEDDDDDDDHDGHDGHNDHDHDDHDGHDGGWNGSTGAESFGSLDPGGGAVGEQSYHRSPDSGDGTQPSGRSARRRASSESLLDSNYGNVAILSPPGDFDMGDAIFVGPVA